MVALLWAELMPHKGHIDSRTESWEGPQRPRYKKVKCLILGPKPEIFLPCSTALASPGKDLHEPLYAWQKPIACCFSMHPSSLCVTSSGRVGDSGETNDPGVKHVEVTEKLARKPRTSRGWPPISRLLLQVPIWQTSLGPLSSSWTLSRYISSRVL